MKLFLLLCSLLAVTVAQEPSLSCNYYRYDTTYGCQLTINNPNGSNNFTEIGGFHLDGFTNADVNSIYGSSGSTANIPQIICDTFPNLVSFELFNAGVTEIDDSAFSGCSSISQLYLVYNRIASISENAFVSLAQVSRITLDDNLLTTLPENLFANQQNLTDLGLSFNRFEDIPAGLFKPLQNLQYLNLAYANLSTINDEWFTENPNLDYLNLAGNRIVLSSDSFAGLEHLGSLFLGDNGINEIPTGVFAGFTNLHSLSLYRNNFTALQADSFPDLGQLTDLDLGTNPITEIEDNAFRGLEGLSYLFLSSCRIRQLNSNSFEGLSNLTYLSLNFNEIEDIPSGIFASMPNLEYIGLWRNHLKTVRRNIFGELTQLQTLDLDMNIVNALDRTIIEDAVNLNTLFLNRNLCVSHYFINFLWNRDQYLSMLEICFANMRYIVDTKTEGDAVYSFFDGPSSGIALRVQSDNEIQVALTSLNSLLTPSIEIFIGSTNNTRSVIRVNEETNVVTVPTPNIIQQNQWNDFRVTWNNQNIHVFSGTGTFPFMSYTMQDLFPVNFYGLRSVETRATWSVQPFQ